MLKPIYDAIPSELQTYPQFVNWRTILRDGKPTKPPFQANGTLASSTDPSTWTDFTTARNAAERFDGIGFVLTKDDPFIGLDFDNCRCPALDGVDPNIAGGLNMILPEIANYVRRINSYTELSPSGKGIRVIVRGRIPTHGAKKGAIEAYQSGRYVTVTGHRVEGLPATIEERSAELAEFYQTVFGKAEKKTDRPYSAPLGGDWQARLQRAFESRSGSDIRRLWRGDFSAYPSQSEADLALCTHLAFWLDGDQAAMDSAFRQSGLIRKKWDEKHGPCTYGEATIQKAQAGCKSFYGDRTQGAPRSDRTQTDVEAPFPFTDYGNAERLVHRFGNDIRYCPPRRRWLLWKDANWEWDDRNDIEKLAKKTVRGIFNSAIATNGDGWKETAKHAIRSESAARIKAMIDLAQSEPGIPIRTSELDTDPWLLNVANGTLDLGTETLRTPVREDLITRRIDVPYDPSATAPLWLSFLRTVMAGNDGLIEFLQKAVGYSLTGDTREQVLLFLTGGGANGKSTFIETITSLMGGYAKHTRPETFMLRNTDSAVNNDLAELEGCRMVAAVELEEGKRLAEVLAKQATGGDTMKARFLFQEFFEFRPQFKLWLCGNHKPRIRGTDHAIWRRMRLVPWPVTIPEEDQDKNLLEKLRGEWPGILTWAVRGCTKWKRYGLDTPAEVKAATASYRREQDILGDFFENCIDIGDNFFVTVKALHEAYVSYCETNGEPVKERLGKKKFGIHVAERGFDQYSATDNVQTWIGLKLKK